MRTNSINETISAHDQGEDLPRMGVEPEGVTVDSTVLNERDQEVLNDLRAWLYGNRWARPMDLGGGSGSHHSATLAKLVRLGYAESKQRGTLAFNSRGSKVYRALTKTSEATP